MSDTSLRDSGEAELQLTTIGWNKAKTYTPEVLATTHWGKGLAYLAAISDVNHPHVVDALVYLKKTTRGYSATATNWKKAFAELAKVTDSPPPPPPPPPPSPIYPASTLYPSETHA